MFDVVYQPLVGFHGAIEDFNLLQLNIKRGINAGRTREYRRNLSDYAQAVLLPNVLGALTEVLCMRRPPNWPVEVVPHKLAKQKLIPRLGDRRFMVGIPLADLQEQFGAVAKHGPNDRIFHLRAEHKRMLTHERFARSGFRYTEIPVRGSWVGPESWDWGKQRITVRRELLL